MIDLRGRHARARATPGRSRGPGPRGRDPGRSRGGRRTRARRPRSRRRAARPAPGRGRPVPGPGWPRPRRPGIPIARDPTGGPPGPGRRRPGPGPSSAGRRPGASAPARRRRCPRGPRRRSPGGSGRPPGARRPGRSRTRPPGRGRALGAPGAPTPTTPPRSASSTSSAGDGSRIGPGVPDHRVQPSQAVHAPLAQADQRARARGIQASRADGEARVVGRREAEGFQQRVDGVRGRRVPALVSTGGGMLRERIAGMRRAVPRRGTVEDARRGAALPDPPPGVLARPAQARAQADARHDDPGRQVVAVVTRAGRWR